MEDKTCKTCKDNDDGLCDRKGILVEDDDECVGAKNLLFKKVFYPC